MQLLASGKSRDRAFALPRFNCFNLKLLMRVTLLSVAFLTCLVTLAGTSSGQNIKEKVTVRFSNTSLKKALQDLEKITKFNFTWRSNDVARSPMVNFEASDEPLFRVLENLLKPASLSFVQRGNNIVLISKPVVIISEPDSSELSPAFNYLPVYDTVPIITVRGRVTSSEKLNEPIANVSVSAGRSGASVMTDPDGYFSIKLAKTNNLNLTFTHIGFESATLRVDEKSQMFVTMKPRAQAMTEVITTGLYKRPKESFTGAATTITGDQIRAVSMTNALSAIKIFDPSIRIPDNIQFGSDPNRLPNISIRGTNNFPQQGSASSVPQSGADFMASYSYNPNQPIFILDGFEVSLQKIYDLDINRIASYTILKDAAATSMYGSRAANGVIIVDTRQPAPGKLQVNYSGSLNLTAPDLSVYNLLSAKEKLEVEKIAGVYTRYAGQTESGAALDAYWRRLRSYRESLVAKGVNTDWMALPLRNGVGSNHSLNLGGGDQFMRYQLNLNYKNDQGVMKGSNRNVYSGDMTLSYRYRGLNFRNAMTIGYSRSNNSPYGEFSEYTKQNPYWAPYDEAGNPVKILEQFENGSTIYTNPLYNSTLNVVDMSEYNSIGNNTEIEWNIGNGFRITGMAGLTRQTEEYDRFLPSQHTRFVNESNPLKRGSYTKSYTKFFNIQTRLKFDYSHRIGRGQLFNTALVELNQSSRNGLTYIVTGFPHERLDDILFGNGYPENSRPSGYKDITRRISFGENFSFTWDQRYAIEGSIRTDGASQFGANKRFASFWSIGGSWNMHQEHWMQKYPMINQFRLRATIGTTGDDRFSTNQAITTYNYYTNTNFHGVPGTNLSTYGNPDLSWQLGIKKNFGLDLVLLNNRLSLSGNYYIENTDKLLLDINTPPSVGVTSYKENIGKLKNTGYEFNIKYNIIHQPKNRMYWSVFFNGSSVESKIASISNSLKKINEQNDNTSGNKQVNPQNKYVEGYSPNAIWGVRSLGIDPSTGREMFLTRDNKITYLWDARDKVIIGDPTGGLFGNFGTNISYKDFTIGLAFNFQTDVTIYNQTLASRVENLDLTWQGDKRVLLDRWKNPGDQTYFKGLRDENGYIVNTPTYVTSRFIQKNNFINLGSISLGYQLPDKISKKVGLKTTRVTLISNEIKRWSSIDMERGLDYPFARVFTFNLVTNF